MNFLKLINNSSKKEKVRTRDMKDLEDALVSARSRLLRQATSYGIAPALAEDIVQETLLEAWRSLEHLRNLASFDAWLSGICRNVCLRWKKAESKSAFRASISLTELETNEGESALADPYSFDPIEALERHDLTVLLDRAIEYLPVGMRKGVELCYLQEIPVEEAAQRLGLTAKALHVRLHRARRLLWKVFNHELRDHAQAFGLLLDQESIEGWRETRIWCLYCGQQRMQGWLELSTAGHADLHLRCARCQREWIRTGARPELSGLKAFRPIFNRAQQFAVEHWTSMLKTRRCSFCHAPTMVRFIAPGEALPLYPAYLPYPGVRIFSHCHTCGFEGTINIGACLRFHPAVQAFIAQQPRWIYLPERGEEYNGQPAFRVELATLASKKRLLAWLDAQSLQVLHVVTE